MAVTLPSIDVTFAQRAATLIERSQRGIAVLIVRDATAQTEFYKFRSLAEAQAAAEDFTTANMAYIKDVYAVRQPYTLCVVRIGATDDVADATEIIEAHLTTGWVTIAAGTSTDFTDLVSWIGTSETAKKTYKAVVFGITPAPDKMHVVDLVNTKVTFSDTRGEQTAEKYLPSLLGILAASNVETGCTAAVCTNLTGCVPVSDPDAAVAAGKFVLINDVDAVRVGVDVNSLTTTNGTTKTEEMKYIETVEAMDLIADDIREEFRTTYLGRYRNSYDNQTLFIAACLGYFRQLAAENILDPAYANTVEIDVAAQRAAWIASGHAEAEGWTDAKVRQMSFRRTVFLAADIKILGSMTNLKFAVALA